MSIKRLKIGIAIDAVHRVGGTQRSTWEIAQWLAKDHDVTLITKTSSATGNEPFKCLVLKNPLFKIPYLSNLAFAVMVSRTKTKLGLDILNVQGSNGLYQDVVTAQSVHKKWYLWSLARTPFLSLAWWKKVLNPLHYIVILLETLQYRPSRHKRIIALSNQVKGDLVSHFNIEPHRISVVHHGVNTSEFDPEKRRVLRDVTREEFGYLVSDIVLIFVAHEFRRKGLKVLLEGLSAVPSTYKLMVIGKDDPSEFIVLAKTLGIRERIAFLGAQKDLSRYYASADIFVFPTSYEAFGMVITEAMAAGLPVIVPRDAGAAELIQHGSGGLLMDRWDDVSQLREYLLSLENLEMRVKMGRDARVVAESRTWSDCAGETLSVYLEVIKGAKKL